MKLKNLLGVSSALCLCVTIAQAQETNEVEQLKQQLQQMQENFEKIETEQQRQIDALQKQLKALAQKQVAVTNVVVASGPTNTVSPEQIKELNDKVDGVVEAGEENTYERIQPGHWVCRRGNHILLRQQIV